MSKFTERLKMNGHLTIKEIYKDPITGSIIDEKIAFDDDNVITDEGFAEFFQRITLPTGTGSIAGSYFYDIRLGDDVGSGTVLNPEAADASYTAANQNVILQIASGDINFTYPNPNQVVLDVALDGAAIMAAEFPLETDVTYTSATLRYFNDKTFSFKRFPGRSISADVTVIITWTVTFNEV